MTNHRAIELTCIEQTEAVDEDGFFWGEGSEQYILQNGVIRQKAYEQILGSKRFAEEYLKLIRDNQIDMAWQTQNLVVIDKLNSLITANWFDYRNLAPLFREAMLVLAEKSGHKLSEIQRHDEIRDAIELGYQYYEFNGLTDSAVAYARSAAVQGMIRKFAEQYSIEGGYKGDLYGSCYLELNKPRVDGIASWLARTYQAENRISAIIHQRDDSTWSLRFFNLIPFNTTNRLNLALETCRAAIPVLEHALEIDAAVYWELSD